MHAKKLKIFIKLKEFDHSRGVFTVALKFTLKINENSVEALFVNDDVHRRSKQATQVSLVNKSRHFTASSQHASRKEDYGWDTYRIRVLGHSERPDTDDCSQDFLL